MAWTTPRTWVAGEVVTAANLNTHLRDNMLAVYPSTPTWTAVTFAAGNFTASGSQTWTLVAGDQSLFKYLVIGKTMHVHLVLTTTTVGGTPSKELRVAIPGGATASGASRGVAWHTNNGTEGCGGFVVSATFISFFLPHSGTDWAASTDNTAIYASVMFEIA